MKTVLIAISITSLVVLFAAPTCHALGIATVEISRYGMGIGTIGWFATAPLWIKRKRS